MFIYYKRQNEGGLFIREWREFSRIDVLLAGFIDPPHPGLLPEEKGKRSQLFEKPSDWMGSSADRSRKRARSKSSPRGEDTGEGEPQSPLMGRFQKQMTGEPRIVHIFIFTSQRVALHCANRKICPGWRPEGQSCGRNVLWNFPTRLMAMMAIYCRIGC